MAGTLSFSGLMQYVNGVINESVNVAPAAAITVAGTTFVKAVETIATTETSVSLPGVTTIGYVRVQNLDSTNYCQVYGATGQAAAGVYLQPGDFAIFRLNGSTLYAKANTASIQLLIFAMPQ